MRKHRRRLSSVAAIIALAVSAGTVHSMDWPLSPPRLAATFGTFAKGRLIAGIALSSDDALVRSAEDGELSFMMEEGSRIGVLPAPLGSLVVIEHQSGMATLYSHLAPDSLSPVRTKPKKGDILGKSGTSGWIEGPGALFQIFDRRVDSWVNPLLVLPALADDKPPVVRSLALSRGDKTYVLGETASLPQGTYKVSVDVADPPDSSWTAAALAPFIISLSIDGVEAVKDVFDVIKGVKGEFFLFSLTPAPVGGLRTLEGRYNLTERLFTRGKTAIALRVEDAAGNKRSVSWTIVVE